MTQKHFKSVLFGALLLITGFMAGRLTAPAAPGEAAPPAAAADAPPPAPPMPLVDVPGHDIPGLPRYPEARRIEYRQTVENNLVLTEAQYVTTADFETVHEYYRQVFNTEGWLVADANFYQREWTFLVTAGGQEALVEVEAEGPLVEIEIELSNPEDSLLLRSGSGTPPAQGGAGRQP